MVYGKPFITKFPFLPVDQALGKPLFCVPWSPYLMPKKPKFFWRFPTGRAARRMAETTSHFAQTVHRLLKFDPAHGGFSMNEQNPLSCDFVIMDESSMLDVRLAAALLRAIPPAAHLLLVGDADQLPSVGSGNVLKDLIQSGELPVTRLQVTFRQAQDSGIVGLTPLHFVWSIRPPHPSRTNLFITLKPGCSLYQSRNS